MKIGSTALTNCKIGSIQVNEVRIGSTLVWSFSSFDPDAQAFITAAGITDPIQQNAINQLVLDLKGYSIWTKMKALYPFVGGTATTHKFNLKNPLDTDAAFRLVFSGGWTHSATGALPNGTNAYANTFLIALSHLGLNSTHISAYSRTNTDKLAPIIANTIGGQANEVSLFIRVTNLISLRVNNPTASTTTNSNATGHYIANRNSSTQIAVFKNNTKTTFNQNSVSLSTNTFLISAISPYYDNKECALASIGDGLTDTEASNFYTAVQTFQTSLFRNI